MGRGVKAAEHGAGIEEQKRALQHGETANQSGEHAAGGADLQRVASAEAPRQRAERQRPHLHAEDVNADRKRGQTLLRRKHGSDNAGGRDHYGAVAARERLRDRQHQRVAPRGDRPRSRPRLVEQGPTSAFLPKGIRVERFFVSGGPENKPPRGTQVRSALHQNGGSWPSVLALAATRRSGRMPISSRRSEATDV